MALTRPLVILFGVAVTACGSGTSSRSAGSSAAAVNRRGAAASAECPRTGHWSACQVRRRLEQSGVAPRDTSIVDGLPALGAAPLVLMAGNARLAVYLYADADTRARAGRGLDSTKFIPAATPLSARGEATAIQNDNLLALLFSRSDAQRERVSDALTAGAPQP